MANLSSSTGYTPLQTRIPLVNNATTNVQDFALYDAQTLTGLVYIDATTDKRAAVTVTVVRNGAGTYEVGATDIVGDDNGGLPIVSFSMSGSILQATLVSYTGFVSAYIQFHLAAPVFGANYPLTVSTTNIVGRTDGAAQSAGYIGETITSTLSSTVISSAAGSALTDTAVGQDISGGSLALSAGVWMILYSVEYTYSNIAAFAADDGGSVACKITKSDNTLLSKSVSIAFHRTATTTQQYYTTTLSKSVVVNIITPTTYKLRGAFTNNSGDNACTFCANGSDYSVFYAVRIA